MSPPTSDLPLKRHAAVSAPGKVLLAGGYLVLDAAYTALVFGLSARIHCVVQEVPADETKEPLIVVRSPQFQDAEWRYGYELLGDAGVKVVQVDRYVPPSFSTMYEFLL
jgi:phosphomevalonate kinase